MDKMVKQLESDQVKFIINSLGPWLTDVWRYELAFPDKKHYINHFHFTSYDDVLKNGTENSVLQSINWKS